MKHLSKNKAVMGGVHTLKNTRIPVEDCLAKLARGWPPQKIASGYPPYVTPELVRDGICEYIGLIYEQGLKNEKE